MAVSTASREVSISSSDNQQIQATPLTVVPQKKKRNLPGMPDAEVIALSPKTLLATNRFVCEICNKGFQRDQNLQLHRRGHNLPWKLKQRTSKEVRKRVYVCPEPTCVHHNPSRALGDLTGIKKHFCRKHGEKKWKCERCSKKYAVQSDWKAHMKTCGTKEYRCDCGTIFSRRDSFTTHRAFCDALAEENARSQQTLAVTGGEGNSDQNAKSGVVVASPPPPPLTPSTTIVSPGLSMQSSEMSENSMRVSPPTQGAITCLSSTGTATVTTPRSSCLNTSTVFASIFASSLPAAAALVEPTSLSLSSSLYLSSNGASSSLFPPGGQDRCRYAPSPQPAMSATALLQKAAQMGAAASSPSLLRGLGLAVPSSSGQDSHVTAEGNPVTAGLGLGLPSEGTSSLTDGIMGPSSLFGNRPTTLDLLGLGIGAGGASTSGLSALLPSFGGGFGVGAAPSTSAPSYGRGGNSPGQIWESTPERKPNPSALL
ncbi:protein indeterminate-domain 2-like isoform X2 [Carica papaya]|uniref:protein indeterminate-domain 2-like isoform X2 n=1 Tax=Carica papaya TaxID=3649 RepID=UPI000B8D0A82|nr:protein indeterminate-domain 2-like isoform X2 [Carica papaya]